jgi:hypothetical protein
MKITSVTTCTAPPRWLLLRVETDDGVLGIRPRPRPEPRSASGSPP